VYAKNCRTCHVNFTEPLNFDHRPNVGAEGTQFNSDFNGIDFAACGTDANGSASFVRNISMPNSLVTFNRYWNSRGTSNDGPAALAAFLNELTTQPGSPGFVFNCAPYVSPLP
jgi:hypothetical protein